MKSAIIKEFIRSPRTVGTIFPSSKYLAKEMLAETGLENARNVVEIGPGSGVFTAYILERIKNNSNTKFIAVEINKEFHSRLTKKFPNATIYNESAENLRQILSAEAIEHADIIISGLPWASFPEKLQDSILSQIFKCLAPNGYFATYAYLQGLLLPGGKSFRKKLGKIFPHIRRSKIVFLNLPPAFVYRCKKS